MYVLIVSNTLRGICLFPFKTPENDDILVLAASGSNYHTYFRYYHPVNHPVLWLYWWQLSLKIFIGIPVAGHMSKAWSHLYLEAKTQSLCSPNLVWFLLLPLPNQPVFLWRCLQPGQGRLPQWGRMPLSERRWRAQMQWWAGASKLAASAVWMHCYLDTWKVWLLLWEENLSCLPFSSSWWEKGIISLCWRVFQLRYCLLLGDCTLCSNLHHGEELLINYTSLFLVFCICAWITMISLYQSSDSVLWSGCPVHSSFHSCPANRHSSCTGAHKEDCRCRDNTEWRTLLWKTKPIFLTYYINCYWLRRNSTL